MTAEVLGAFKAGYGAIRHVHIPHHRSHIPAVSMGKYLESREQMPYLSDGSLPPEPGRVAREVRGTIDLSAFREI